MKVKAWNVRRDVVEFCRCLGVFKMGDSKPVSVTYMWLGFCKVVWLVKAKSLTICFKETSSVLPSSLEFQGTVLEIVIQTIFSEGCNESAIFLEVFVLDCQTRSISLPSVIYGVNEWSQRKCSSQKTDRKQWRPSFGGCIPRVGEVRRCWWWCWCDLSQCYV